MVIVVITVEGTLGVFWFHPQKRGVSNRQTAPGSLSGNEEEKNRSCYIKRNQPTTHDKIAALISAIFSFLFPARIFLKAISLALFFSFGLAAAA